METIVDDVALLSDVDEFLSTTEFSGYQSVPLPHGRKIPGREKHTSTDFYLSGRVAGKSLLDIGTYYGLYPYEAIQRGATRAVGVEADPGRYSIARRAAELNGSKYDIVQSSLE